MVVINSKYSNGKIYKIINDIDQLIYVGSTITSLNSRFTRHIYASKLYPERKLYKHFTKHGIEHFKIILIKLYPCNNKLELEIEEELYKIDLNAQLNTYRAHQTAEQKKEQMKEWHDQNYKKNRAKIILKQKEYDQNNRAKISLHSNERLFCKICGKSYTRQNKLQHCRSKRHQKCIQLNQSKQITNQNFEKYVKNDKILKA
jgi:hypothetical protein